MSIDITQSEIERLEDILVNFKKNWDQQQKINASKWRFSFLLGSFVTLVISLNSPSLWWLNAVVISYFAVSLFLMLRQRADVYQRLIEHQKQLELARFLKNFQRLSYLKN